MIKISGVIITYNESERIECTIRALKWCNEIVVVDSGSTDQTLEICRESGCRVFQHPFKSYGDQKNYGVSQASNDWILSVDADEVITLALKEEIKQVFSEQIQDFNGFLIPARLIFMNKEFRFGKESNNFHVRLFNRQFSHIDHPEIHEKIVTTGMVGKMNGHLLHYSYIDLRHYFEKFNSYTTKAALELNHKKKKIFRGSIFIRFPINFIKFYFLRGNFLNGFEGFVWSWLCSIYTVVKYLKAFELMKMNGK